MQQKSHRCSDKYVTSLLSSVGAERGKTQLEALHFISFYFMKETGLLKKIGSTPGSFCLLNQVNLSHKQRGLILQTGVSHMTEELYETMLNRVVFNKDFVSKNLAVAEIRSHDLSTRLYLCSAALPPLRFLAATL